MTDKEARSNKRKPWERASPNKYDSLANLPIQERHRKLVQDYGMLCSHI